MYAVLTVLFRHVPTPNLERCYNNMYLFQNCWSVRLMDGRCFAEVCEIFCHHILELGSKTYSFYHGRQVFWCAEAEISINSYNPISILLLNKPCKIPTTNMAFLPANLNTGIILCLSCWECLPYVSDHKTHFFPPEKCDLNLTCVLYAEGKYLFPNLWISLHLLYDIFIVR